MLTFTLNLRNYPSNHELHQQLRDLGFADGGFIPPRFGFNRRLGIMNYKKLLNEARRLDRLCPAGVPLILDLERAYRWARANPPGPRDNIPLNPVQCYDLIRETTVVVREALPHRYWCDWKRPAGWTNPLTDRLGCAYTCCCPVTNRRTEWDDDRWLAVRSQEYDETLTWRMPVYLWMSDWNWQVAGRGTPSHSLTDREWQMMIDFAVERDPDWIIFSGAGTPSQILTNARRLKRAYDSVPDF